MRTEAPLGKSVLGTQFEDPSHHVRGICEHRFMPILWICLSWPLTELMSESCQGTGTASETERAISILEKMLLKTLQPQQKLRLGNPNWNVTPEHGQSTGEVMVSRGALQWRSHAQKGQAWQSYCECMWPSPCRLSGYLAVGGGKGLGI